MTKKLLVVTLAIVYLTGCGTGSSDPETSTPSQPSIDDHSDHDHDDHDHGDQDAHDHASHGPHEGDLVELGKGAYHLEFTNSEAEVTFYVLDEKAADRVAIDAESLTVSLKHDGQVKSFELDAAPQTNDGEGKSSRFKSSDPEFTKWMEAEAEGAATVRIGGKSLTGKISHDHDH